MKTSHEDHTADSVRGSAMNAADFQLASQLSTALVNIYNTGNMVLVLVFVGVLLMFSAGIAQPTGPTLWFLLIGGAAALIVPISLTWWRGVRPIQDLKKRVDEQAAFINGVQENSLRATEAMRSLSSEVIVKQDKFASAIKAARPFFGDYPIVASWIDKSEDLGSELARHAVLARDISYRLENAIRTGDTGELKVVATELKQLVESIENAPSLPAELAATTGRYDDILAELEASGVLAILNQVAAALARVVERRSESQDSDETDIIRHSSGRKLIAEVLGELDRKTLWAAAPKLLGLLKKTEAGAPQETDGSATK